LSFQSTQKMQNLSGTDKTSRVSERMVINMKENIKAVVLAGGMGTRLLPITCTIPKPLAPILGESVLKHIIRLIAKSEIYEATLTTMYLPEKIKAELGEQFYGVKIDYINEDQPKGTAGGVKNAAVGSKQDILVMSGDGICDFDLKSAIEFHRKKNADVTIVTYKTDNPLEYGVVCSEEDGKIYEFREKPPWAQVASNMVNTGIYILKNEVVGFIPDEGAFDFSKDLFPLLMKNGKALYAFGANGFWCDIGDIDEYYKCNMKALDGEISNLLTGESYERADLDLLGCTVKYPVWVSKQAKLGEEVTIGPYSVIGKGTVIESGAKIEYSILHENVIVGKKTKIQSSILCDRAIIGEMSTLKPGCVVGSDSDIGKGTVLKERTRLLAGERVYMMNETCFKDKKCGLFCNDGIYIGTVSNTSMESCTKIGFSLGQTLNKLSQNGAYSKRIGVMHDGTDRSELICDALLCGVRSSGVHSYHFGSGFFAMAGFAAVSFITDIVVYICMDDHAVCTIKLLDRLSLPVSHSFERTFESIYADHKEVIPERIYDTEVFEGLKFLYYSEMLKGAKNLLEGKNLSGLSCKVKDNGQNIAFSSSHLLKRAVNELSGTITDQGDFPELSLSEDGGSPEVYDSKTGTHLDSFHINAILLYDAAKSGIDSFVLPYLSPEIYRSIAKQAKCAVTDYLYYANKDNSIPRELMVAQIWLNDGVFASLRLLALMKKKGKTIAELLAEVPKFEVFTGDFEEENSDRAQVMTELSHKEKEHGTSGEREGIRLAFSGGRVTVIPKRQGGFRLISEAENYEMAKELCGEAVKQLKRNG